MQAALKNKKSKVRRVPATIEHWVAFDQVFRTLVSEVAGENCSLQQIKAAGKVMLNRIDFARRHADTRDANGNPYSIHFINVLGNQETSNTALVPHMLTQAVRRKGQFSGWNKSPGSNKLTACPALAFTEDPERIPKRYLQRIDMIAHVASEMIFNEKEFRDATAGVTARYYTSGKKAGEDFQKTYKAEHVAGQTVDGVSVNDQTCTQFWRVPRIEDNAEDQWRVDHRLPPTQRKPEAPKSPSKA